MLTRRDFLILAARLGLGLSGVLGLAGLARFFSYQPAPPPPKRYAIGPETNFLPNSRTVLPDIPALLIRGRDDYRAYSMVCTHLGCTVEYKAGEFVCQCHGSRYGSSGAVMRGPAVAPLPELKVERTPDGNLEVIVS